MVSAPTALDFDVLMENRRGRLAYIAASLGKFPPVRRNTGPKGPWSGPDREFFLRKLHQCIAKVYAGDVEVFVGFYTRSPPRLRVIVYGKERRVLPLEVEVVAELRSWLTTLSKSQRRRQLTRDERGLTFRVAENSLSIAALEEEELAALDARPIALVVSSAPPAFKRKEAQARKAAHLAKLDAKKGGRAPVQAAAVGRLFRAFLATLKGAKKKPLKLDERFKALETRVGVRLPSELKALYRCADGGKLFFGYTMLSLAQVEKHWAMWASIFDEWTIEELTGNVSGQRGVTQGLYCCPRWVPFIDLEGSHYLAVDMLPGPKGNVGQIIVFGRNMDTVRRVAPDMRTFLELCLTFDGKTNNSLASVFTDLEY